jgi:1-deoxy-D-xylulose-5-phosphate synthase
MIADAARHCCVLTLEDGIRDGGIGALLADAVAATARAAGTPMPRIETRGIPTRFIPHAKPDAILAQLGLDAAGIVATARELTRPA